MWMLICILSLDQQSWQVPTGNAPDGGAAATAEHRGLFFSKLLNTTSYIF